MGGFVVPVQRRERYAFPFVHLMLTDRCREPQSLLGSFSGEVSSTWANKSGFFTIFMKAINVRNCFIFLFIFFVHYILFLFIIFYILFIILYFIILYLFVLYIIYKIFIDKFLSIKCKFFLSFIWSTLLFAFFDIFDFGYLKIYSVY